MQFINKRRMLCTIALLGLWAYGSGAIGDDQVQKLVAVLQGDAPTIDKVRACQQLSAMGRKEAAPALAALLADNKLASYARQALEATADPAADAALRNALSSLQGNARSGVINALGMRRDAAAVEALGKIVTEQAASAAESLVALGKIANPAAIAILKQTLANGPAELRPAAADGTLIAADQQLAAGQRQTALELYDAVRHAAVPKPYQLAGLHGAIVAGRSADLLIEQLRSEDTDVFRIGLTASRELPAREITAALVAELPKRYRRC